MSKIQKRVCGVTNCDACFDDQLTFEIHQMVHAFREIADSFATMNKYYQLKYRLFERQIEDEPND